VDGENLKLNYKKIDRFDFILVKPSGEVIQHLLFHQETGDEFIQGFRYHPPFRFYIFWVLPSGYYLWALTFRLDSS
jgi:hypothetical protein